MADPTPDTAKDLNMELDKELDFLSSTSNYYSKEKQEDTEILEILDGARAQFIKSVTQEDQQKVIEEQQKMIEDLHSENEALKEENLQLNQKIDDLTHELQNPERDIEEKAFENINSKVENIKDRLDKFDDDGLVEELQTLRQIIREKDDKISELELNAKHYESNSSSNNLRYENIIKHKDESIKELKIQIATISESWYSFTKDFCDLAIDNSLDTDEMAEKLSEKLAMFENIAEDEEDQSDHIPQLANL